VFSNHYFRRCRPIAVLVLVVLLGLAVPICYPRDASSTKTETLGLRVSDTGHYLLKDGAPFFWLGDTAWSLVNRYSREEAEDYLERRRKQGSVSNTSCCYLTEGRASRHQPLIQKGQNPS
jgi:hypothetical protein